MHRGGQATCRQADSHTSFTLAWPDRTSGQEIDLRARPSPVILIDHEIPHETFTGPTGHHRRLPRSSARYSLKKYSTMESPAGNTNVRSIDDIEDLANVILANAKTVKSFLSGNELPAPSFSVDAPFSFPDCPQDVRKARSQLLDASKKIQQLALGPIDHLFWYSCSVCPSSTLVSYDNPLLTVFPVQH